MTEACAYDALSRPVSRNGDTFGYNARGEVVSSRGGAERSYAYDCVGNAVLAASGGITNAYTANALNQYASVLRASAPPRETIPQYDADGSLVAFGAWAFAYDAANRLVSVSSNGVLLVTNFYDAKSRRVKKATAEATTTFFYDDWNLVEERVAYTNRTKSTIRYCWGKDVSDTFQGAGGIGGLLYLTVDGTIYIPCYDNNGNVTRYLDGGGNTVAAYTYDAFGNTISKSGPLADLFRHRFSTKYFDAETGLYYYGYRFYSPSLMRWLNRDPIEEKGGLNLYGFCGNSPISRYDRDGRAYFAVRPLSPMPIVVKWSLLLCPFNLLLDGVWARLVDDAADILNVEILHEQLFFEDNGKSLMSIGWGGENGGSTIENESPGQYLKRDDGYDDCIMRIAVSEVKMSHYQLTWIGSKSKCNCQDYADALRAKYREISNRKDIKCRCNNMKGR